MVKSKKPPRDINALAAYIVQEATGEPAPDTNKNASAAIRGRLGGHAAAFTTFLGECYS